VLSGEIEYDFGDNLQDACKKFSDDAVFSLYTAQAKIGCQAAMRRELESETGDVKRVATIWKPGVKLERVVDPVAAAKQHFANLDPEAQKAFLKMLQQG
jgi:hypothetical protein